MRCDRSPVRGWNVLAALLIASFAGCQAMNTDSAKLAGELPASQSGNPQAPEDSGPKFQIEIRRQGHQPQLSQVALPDVLYVQQALEKSGALARFRRMKIEIYRQLPSGGGQRLDVPFDRSKHRVPAGADYAIHANDRLVITEDSTTIVDDMMETLGGPFSK